MIRATKRVYNRLFAVFMLLTAETLITLFLFIISFVTFIVITRYIFIESKQTFDTIFFDYIVKYITPTNTDLMFFFTGLGNYQFLVIANLSLVAWFLFVRKHRWYSIKIGSIALSSLLMMLLLKTWFNRKRPPVPLFDPAIGLSFPSGHAMSSVTFYGLLIYFIWKKRDSNIYLRVLLISFFVVVILMIGLSRIYLHVHYASDVIGGFCTGIIWLVISIWILDKIENYSKTELHDRI